jgi:alkylhydroperoxidase family enzyme
MHTTDTRAGGETEQRFYALQVWKETLFFTDRERAVEGSGTTSAFLSFKERERVGGQRLRHLQLKSAQLLTAMCAREHLVTNVSSRRLLCNSRP